VISSLSAYYNYRIIIFINTPFLTYIMNKRTARIPVFPETLKKLISKKLKIQAKLDKKLTWDEFLLKECDC